jgi:hypothetical protein
MEESAVSVCGPFPIVSLCNSVPKWEGKGRWSPAFRFYKLSPNSNSRPIVVSSFDVTTSLKFFVEVSYVCRLESSRCLWYWNTRLWDVSPSMVDSPAQLKKNLFVERMHCLTGKWDIVNFPHPWTKTGVWHG